MQDGVALAWASEELREHKDVVAHAIEHGYPVEYVSEALQADRSDKIREGALDLGQADL